MCKTPEENRIRILQKYQILAEHKNVPVLELFQRFELAGIKHKGLYTCQYLINELCEGKRKISNFHVPLFEIKEGQFEKEVSALPPIYIMQRLPGKYNESYDTEDISVNKSDWNNQLVLCQMKMYGQTFNKEIPFNQPEGLIYLSGKDENGYTLNIPDKMDIDIMQFDGGEIEFSNPSTLNTGIEEKSKKFLRSGDMSKVEGKISKSSKITAESVKEKIPEKYKMFQFEDEYLVKKKVDKYFDPINKFLDPEKLKAARKWAEKNENFSFLSKAFDTNPKEVFNKLNNQFPEGPLLNDKEMNAIMKCSESKDGKNWLKCAGLFDVDLATIFLKEHKYYNWLKFTPAIRVLLGSMAYTYYDLFDLEREDVIDTPAYRFGLSAYIRELEQGSLSDPRIKNLKYMQDLGIRKEWLKTFLSPSGKLIGPEEELSDPVITIAKLGHIKGKNLSEVQYGNIQTTKILKNILILLHSGLEYWDKDKRKYLPSEGAVVRALSHGGRVNIRIPALNKNFKNKFAITDWIGITTEGVLNNYVAFVRPFGTHGILIKPNKNGKPGDFEEIGGALANVKNKPTPGIHIWGINISAGGIGQEDVNGDLVIPDGGHGHVFAFYSEPTLDTDGVLQIGIETVAPGGDSQVGHVHDSGSSEATANPESSFGGLKKDKVGDQKVRKATLRPNVTKKIKKTKLHDGGTMEYAPGRYVNLVKIGEGDYINYLEIKKNSFDKVKELYGNVTAFADLIGEGMILKRTFEEETKKVNNKKGLCFINMVTAKNPASKNALRMDAMNRDGSYELLAYRFQNYSSDGTSTLITTQDTLLTYRTVEHWKIKNKNYRMMTYTAVTANWIYPIYFHPITSGSGSGVSFGCSVNLETLLKYDDFLTQILSEQLHLPAEMLKNFFEVMDFSKITKEDLGGIEILIIESSFAFGTKSPKLELNFTNGKYEIKDLFSNNEIKNFMGNLDNLENLSVTIKLRMRLSDQPGKPDTPYKLGITNPKPVNNYSPTESVINLFTWFPFGKKSIKKELYVQPVIFFHPVPHVNPEIIII